MSESAIVATIPANVGAQATRIAIMAGRLDAITEQRKAASKAIRERKGQTDAQQTANELKQELRKATLETRKEIREYEAEAARDPAVVQMTAELDALKDRAKTLAGLIRAESREHAGQLELFAREVGL